MALTEIIHAALLEGMDVPGLDIPAAWVRFVRQGLPVPAEVSRWHEETDTPTACMALGTAMRLDRPVYLTLENIGCVAAAVTFGFVAGEQDTPLEGPRTYTEIMRRSSGLEDEFTPPPPSRFQDGSVYACKASGHPEYALFGPGDSGRFQGLEQARSAIRDMAVIQPPCMQGVFFAPMSFNPDGQAPDVVVLSVRPAELLRIVQAWQFITGERFAPSMGPLRAVDSDLVVRPYLTGRMNLSAYCLGGRILGGFEPDRMGLGIPWRIYQQLPSALEASRTGYPFHLYEEARKTPDDSAAPAK